MYKIFSFECADDVKKMESQLNNLEKKGYKLISTYRKDTGFYISITGIFYKKNEK